MDVRDYGSAADNQLAMSILPELRNRICKYHQTIKDVLVHNLAMIIEVLHFIQAPYFVHNQPFSYFLVFLFLFL